MVAVITETLPPQPTVLPHQLVVPDDLMLPGIVGNIFATGVISLIILANQEQAEGSDWTGVTISQIDRLALQHYDQVKEGLRGGEMFADNPRVGVEAGVEILSSCNLIKILPESNRIALTRPLIESLKVFTRH